MNIADPAAALDILREFQRLLVRDRRDWEAKTTRKHLADVRKTQPLIERIAERIDPANVKQLEEGPGFTNWKWNSAYAETLRLIGILEQREAHQRILGPEGPKLLANRLHPWVWSAAANLCDDGHHGAAVEAASKKVDLQTQKKLGSRKRYGKDLYAQAFSTDAPKPDAPRLRFSHIDEAEEEKAWTSAHEGAMHLGMGCAQGIRNLRMHPSQDTSEQENDEQKALEQLAALSVLARWVEACEVVPAAPALPDGG